MDRLIKESDAIEAVWKPQVKPNEFIFDALKQAIESGIRNCPTADDRPQGDVDAIDILMREMHNVDQGYITIGEFDERTEPLRHLCYGRPQGEWTQNVLRPDVHRYECSNCKAHHIARYDYCPSCGARMRGADDE